MTRIYLSRPMLSMIAVASFLTLSLMGCKKDAAPSTDPLPLPELMPSPGPDLVFYGLTDDNKLNTYNAKTPGAVISSTTITGLQTAERMLSIDFRPATGQLFGLGSTSRLYVINLADGVAKAVGTTAFTPIINSVNTNIDFNPTVDRIRLVSVSGQNLRLHPETGAVAFTDGNINGGMNPGITSIAYTNSSAGATTTDLFDIDISQKKLYKQTPPNDGTLAEVGPLNVNFVGKGGFDVGPNNTVSLATFTVSGKTRLYTINLSTGAATYINEMPGNILDIAIPTPPAAYAVDEANNLLIFNPAAPQTVITKAITGLQAGEQIHGIDFRPANGQLFAFAVGMNGAARLYVLNTASGAATAVGTGFTVSSTATSFAFDFNPTVDRIRLISNTGQNLRLNPNDGTIAATDGNINPGSPAVSGAAYTNNFNGTTSTVLFVLDGGNLYRQDPPNNGTLVSIGALNQTVLSGNGFDIGGRSGTAYAILTSGTTTQLYTVNLTTGALTAAGMFSSRVRGFALGLGF